MFRWITVFLFMAVTAQAHHLTGVQREDPSYRAEGNMLLFIAVPRDKNLKLYLVGKEAAQMNFNKDSKLVSVSLWENNKKRNLQFRQVGNSYEILDLPKKGRYNMDFEAEVQSKPDTVRMSIEMP